MTTVSDRPTDDLEGIAGWLLLPAIGTFVAPLTYAWTLVQDIQFMSSHAVPRGLGGVFLLEAATSAICVIGWSWAIYLLLNKKRRYPSVFVALVTANLISTGLVAMMLSGTRFWSPAITADIARTIVPAIVWIPYMLVSKRVKATFTRER